MDTRRFRHSSRSDAFAAFRWLGWVMLMMFVLAQTAAHPVNNRCFRLLTGPGLASALRALPVPAVDIRG